MDYADIVDRVRNAFDRPDIILAVSPENQRTTNKYAMSGYQLRGFEVATAKKVAFANMQAAFGDNPSEYADGSVFPLMKSDGIHGNDDGNAAMAALVYPILTN